MSYYPCTPDQDIYLAPYQEDKAVELAKISLILNLFTNWDTTTIITDLSDDLPQVNAIGYKFDYGKSFDVTHIGGTGNGYLTISDGIVYVQNIGITIPESFNLNLNNDSHWYLSQNGIDEDDSITDVALVCFFNSDPSPEQYCSFMFVKEDDYNTLTTQIKNALTFIKFLRVVKVGSNIIQVYMQNESFNNLYRCVELVHQRNIVLDGGEID